MSVVDATALRASLVAPSGPYAALDVVPSTGSTNADLAAAAVAGAADRTVLIAERQTAGRGRRGREWVSPPAGVYLSVLLRPDPVPAARLGGLAVVAGLALVRTAAGAGVAAELKWPNDLLAGAGKCAGVLSEAVPGGVVVGIGLNVAALPAEVPPGPGGLPATSLEQSGAGRLDRTAVAGALLAAFAEYETRWRAADGDLAAAGLLDEYRRACRTLGRRVRVELPDGELTGTATGVDAGGELVVDTDGGTRRTLSAGDVVHLRATP
ncbi:MAG TPA: biotin--[acetyl-CoA-carboxylase] ligase [Actinophytocola sp.]|uniref:biotin--[acetyl-CoA-carboxylase] ligase n=1 Tax=Actinophytocola sp. TaxID=1872138 RepID=UPI002DBE345B|nr:biotin--[acetyl-CoA-carboxylase] ligase [Actinophytocola sp.]HEU5475801.1 biotin--[acetyl-CoA-carboxylase] ligase [Actinophytocola sp.]